MAQSSYCIIGNLIGLAGEKEHLHYLTCIKNNIDPNKVKPKKFASFARGQQFEGEAVKDFVIQQTFQSPNVGFSTTQLTKNMGEAQMVLALGFY